MNVTVAHIHLKLLECLFCHFHEKLATKNWKIICLALTATADLHLHATDPLLTQPTVFVTELSFLRIKSNPSQQIYQPAGTDRPAGEM